VALTVTDDDGATASTSKSVTVTEGSTNNPPSASFTSSCTDLTCNFTDTSTDSDGDVVAWSWTFGAGASSTEQNPSHTYAAAGTYTVSLTVTDDDGATGSTTQEVTVTEPSTGQFTLSAIGYKVKGRKHADLTWSGATSTNVDVYRDGSVIATTANDGAHTDATDSVGGGTYTYQVCEEGTTTCSNEATVTF
jgi:serine protease